MRNALQNIIYTVGIIGLLFLVLVQGFKAMDYEVAKQEAIGHQYTQPQVEQYADGTSDIISYPIEGRE